MQETWELEDTDAITYCTQIEVPETMK